MSCKAPGETRDKTIVGSRIPWTKRSYRPARERRQELPARSTRCKRDIRFAQAEQVVHRAVIVIGLDDDVLDLLLHSDADAPRKRRLETAIDIRRKQLRRNRGVRKRAERPPEKEPWRLSYRGRSLEQGLVRRQARQRLNVAEIDNRIRGNEWMSRRDDAIQSIDADEESRRKRTRDIPRRDLRIRQVRRDAQAARKQRRVDRCRCECRNAVETARIRERLDHPSICAAESRHVAHETESKLIVEDHVMT